MSVVKLSIKNFLSIADVEISPGKVNQIHGQNNQGKTTVLKALEFAFKGSTDGSLVKHGTEQAEVIVELDNEMTIRRTLRPEGKQAVSVTKGGFKADSPQSFLTSLFDGMSFNPLEILNPKTRTQFILKALDLRVSRAELAELSGIDAEDLPPLEYEKENALVVIEQAYKYFYNRRAEANKLVSEKKKRYETYLADLPEENPPVRSRAEIEAYMESIKAIRDEQKKLYDEVEAEQKAAALATQKVSRYESELLKINKEIDDLQAEYEKRHAVLLERLENGRKAVQSAKEEVKPARSKDMIEESIRAYDIDLSEANVALKDVAVYEAQQEHRKVVQDMKLEVEQAILEAEKIDLRVQALGVEAKEKIMSKADLPVEGLSYADGEFGLNGASLDHLSSSMALKLSLALVKKLADKTKLVCIDGAELLDVETFNTLIDEMQADEYTYFFTKVGDAFEGPDKNFKAEAGEVKEVSL